jgi:hypothetical protein
MYILLEYRHKLGSLCLHTDESSNRPEEKPVRNMAVSLVPGMSFFANRHSVHFQTIFSLVIVACSSFATTEWATPLFLVEYLLRNKEQQKTKKVHPIWGLLLIDQLLP